MPRSLKKGPFRRRPSTQEGSNVQNEKNTKQVIKNLVAAGRPHYFPNFIGPHGFAVPRRPQAYVAGVVRHRSDGGPTKLGGIRARTAHLQGTHQGRPEGQAPDEHGYWNFLLRVAIARLCLCECRRPRQRPGDRPGARQVGGPRALDILRWTRHRRPACRWPRSSRSAAAKRPRTTTRPWTQATLVVATVYADGVDRPSGFVPPARRARAFRIRRRNPKPNITVGGGKAAGRQGNGARARNLRSATRAPARAQAS